MFQRREGRVLVCVSLLCRRLTHSKEVCARLERSAGVRRGVVVARAPLFFPFFSSLYFSIHLASLLATYLPTTMLDGLEGVEPRLASFYMDGLAG